MIKHFKDTISYQHTMNILEEKVIAGRWIKLQAQAYLKDLERDDLYFDLKKIEQVDQYFGEIIYVPELKKPVALQPPRAFHLHQLFGFYYKETGLRRYTSAYYQISRKNLKTFDCAGIITFEGFTGRDKYQEVMVGANSRDQAIICTDKAGSIIKASPELLELMNEGSLNVHTYKKLVNTITYEDENRKFRIEAMPKDPRDGGNPGIVITDEAHEAKTLSHIEAGESGQALRLEPLNEVITSPGHNKQGPCYAVLRRKCIDILEGRIVADRHLPLVYEMDSEAEVDEIISSIDLGVEAEKQLHKVAACEKSNPLFRYIPGIQRYLVERAKKAKAEGGQTMANVKIKNFGIWIDAPVIWLPSDKVKSNNHGITDDDLIGQECYAGLDLAASQDLNAFGLLFPNVKGKKVWKCWFWLTEERVLMQKKDSVDYRRWVDEGWIIMQQGRTTIDYEPMADLITQAHQKYKIKSFGIDMAMVGLGVAPFLSDNIEVTPIGQTLGNLTAPTTQIERWILEEEMDLMKNPVMEMCFANVTLKIKDISEHENEGGHSGHRMPSKAKSNGRIDGVAALNNAVFEYLRLGHQPKKQIGIIEMKY